MFTAQIIKNVFDANGSIITTVQYTNGVLTVTDPDYHSSDAAQQVGTINSRLQQLQLADSFISGNPADGSPFTGPLVPPTPPVSPS